MDTEAPVVDPQSTHPHSLKHCPKCGTPAEPEPTDEERAKIFADPDYTWEAPPGPYLCFGFGLMGGGYGSYAVCEKCEFFLKVESPDSDDG